MHGWCRVGDPRFSRIVHGKILSFSGPIKFQGQLLHIVGRFSCLLFSFDQNRLNPCEHLLVLLSMRRVSSTSSRSSRRPIFVGYQHKSISQNTALLQLCRCLLPGSIPGLLGLTLRLGPLGISLLDTAEILEASLLVVFLLLPELLLGRHFCLLSSLSPGFAARPLHASDRALINPAKLWQRRHQTSSGILECPRTRIVLEVQAFHL
mmetsp:Transcript_7287/g.13221  ORF Transcript_7287/g.13221 Transcript_7287/m.13221 type:complete len:207 (-) Transcript_7287:134-754(-)